MSRSSSIGAATLGHLRRSAQLLEVLCGCGRVVRLDPTQLDWPDEVEIPQVKTLLRCSECGARPAQTRPDCRVHGVDGRYPAF